GIHEPEYLPVRHVRPDRARHRARGEGGVNMTRRKAEGGRRKDNPRGAREARHSSPIAQHPALPGRRRFMLGAAGLTFGVALGVPDLSKHAAAQVIGGEGIVVNPWVTLYGDGTVAIMSPAAEMGQGSLTSLPRVL